MKKLPTMIKALRSIRKPMPPPTRVHRDRKRTLLEKAARSDFVMMVIRKKRLTAKDLRSDLD